MLYSSGRKKPIKTSISPRAKEAGFGLAVIVHMDFLCIDTPVHAIGLWPAPPQPDEPGKQPWQKSKLHKLR